MSKVTMASFADISEDHVSRVPSELDAFNVQDYGALGDAVTDDSAAIQSAIAAAEAADFGALAAGPTLYMPPVEYLIKTGLNFGNINIEATGAKLLVHGDITGAAVTIGTSSSSTTYKTLNLPEVRRVAKIWVKNPVDISTDRGVVFVAAAGCIVNVGDITHFSYGLVLEGDGQGVSYNIFHLTLLSDNAINLYIHSVNSGWSQQNTFIGGRLVHATEGLGSIVVGTRQIQIGSNKSTNAESDNLFLGTSLEGTIFEFQLDCWSKRNTFINCRWEYTTPQTAGQVRWSAYDGTVKARANMIINGAVVDSINVTTDSNAIRNSIFSPVTTLNHGDTGWHDSGDAYPRLLITAELGRLYLGPGSTDPTAAGAYLRGATNDLWELTVARFDVKDLKIDGDVGFYDTAPQSKPTITGARDETEGALVSLLDSLEGLGLITDSTTAS